MNTWYLIISFSYYSHAKNYQTTWKYLLFIFFTLFLVNQYTKSTPTPPEQIPQPFDQISHFELIKKYLTALRLRRKEEIALYQPSDWEKLSPTEQLQLAIYHAHQRDQEDTAALIKLNQIKRRNQERIDLQKQQLTQEYKDKHYNSQLFLFFIILKIIKSTKNIYSTLIFPLVSTNTNSNTSNTSVAHSAQALAEPHTGKLILITLIIFWPIYSFNPPQSYPNVYQVTQARSPKPLTPSH